MVLRLFFFSFLILLLGGIYGVLSSIHPFVGLVFLAVAVIGCVIWKEPAWGLLLVLFAIPLQFLGKLNEDGSLTIAKVVTPCVVLVWFFKYLINKDKRLLKVPFSHPILISSFIYLFSTIPSFFNARSISSSICYLLFKLFPLWLLMVLIVDLLQTPKWLERSYKAILTIAFVVGCFGIYELITGQSILQLFGMKYYLISGAKGGGLASTKWEQLDFQEAAWVRVASTFLDPDFFASFLLLILGFSFGFLFTTKSTFWRLFCIVLIIIALIDIVGTGSRSVFLGVFIFFLVLLAVVNFKGKWLLIGILAFLGVLIIPSIEEYIPSFRKGLPLSLEDFKKDPRYGFWLTALKMILKHPILGIGLGNFTEVYYHYRDEASILLKPYLPHDIVLLVFSETGIIGLVFFSVFVITVLITLIKNHFTQKNRTIWVLNLFIFASFLGYCVFALASNTLDQEYIWIVCGFVALFSKMKGEQSLCCVSHSERY